MSGVPVLTVPAARRITRSDPPARSLVRFPGHRESRWSASVDRMEHRSGDHTAAAMALSAFGVQLRNQELSLRAMLFNGT